MSEIDWEQEWKNAREKTMMSRCRNGGFGEYFDGIAEDYLRQVRADEEFYGGIVGYLGREGFFREGDDVLDIACGPATYTLHFAERARSVAALDPAQGMLSVVMREAAVRGLSNVRPIRSRWEDYDGDERFDLVFTALSPGITGPESLLKMERHSRRSCCYIGFGEGSNNELGDELWALVAGEGRKMRGVDMSYPFNLLFSKGRRPNVRFFKKEYVAREPCEKVIKSNVEWLGMFTRMDSEKVRKVSEHIMSLSRDGFYEHVQKQSLVVLYWNIP